MNLKELENKRDEIVTGFFWVALSTVFVFGIPALIAVYAGKKLNTVFGLDIMQYVLLFFAFVISWGIVAREYNKKTKVLKELREQILKAREEEKNNK
jgi:hypothetical protein